MTPHLRLVDPTADYPRVAALLNTAELEPIPVADLLEEAAGRSPADIVHETVALGPDGEPVAYADCRHLGWMKPGRFFIYIVTDPAHQGQGYGGLLYRDAYAFALRHGATEFQTQVRDDLPAALAFAKARDFVVERHVYESKLDLAAFDEAPYAGALAAAASAGYRLSTLAELGDTPEARRRLYELARVAGLDNPANTSGDFPSFDEWSRDKLEAGWFRPDGVVIALAGEAFAGFSLLRLNPETNSAYTVYTGVNREHRGTGLALAMKLRSVRFAREAGAAYMRTMNDSQNAAMLAVNRRLGYIAEVGTYRMKLALV